jgi:hypothetical protein
VLPVASDARSSGDVPTIRAAVAGTEACILSESDDMVCETEITKVAYERSDFLKLRDNNENPI